MIHGRNRTTGMIRELSLRVDSQNMKYRVMNIPRTQRMFLRSLSEAIR